MPHLPLTISFDHALVDGAPAARFHRDTATRSHRIRRGLRPRTRTRTRTRQEHPITPTNPLHYPAARCEPRGPGWPPYRPETVTPKRADL